MKKHYAILCAVVLALSTLIGCGKASDSPAANGENNASSPKSDNNNTSEVVRIKYVVPGTEPKDYQKVFEKVNEKLAADGVGVEVEKIFIPWDAWDQKLNLMLSTGEEFDLFHVMQDRTPFSNYYTRGRWQISQRKLKNMEQTSKAYSGGYLQRSNHRREILYRSLLLG